MTDFAGTPAPAQTWYGELFREGARHQAWNFALKPGFIMARM